MPTAKYHLLTKTSSNTFRSRRPTPSLISDMDSKPSRRKPLSRRACFRRYCPFSAQLALIFTLLVALTLVLTFLLWRNVGLNDGAIVDLGYTRVRPVVRDGISETLGIRYAAAPIDYLRFAAPQDPPLNRSVQPNEHHARCLTTGVRRVEMGTDEDCLFLDVYAPVTATEKEPLPVFFWIQGGGFNSLSNDNYSGAGLINASDHNIVVVTLSYRVGPYGFLASKEVKEEASLNNGLKDQMKALQWVQQYISRFGGNASHVVIGGDSAGGASVTLLMAAYGGRNNDTRSLFHAAAAESQSFAAVQTVAQSQTMYDALVNRTGCANSTWDSTLTCMQMLSQEELQFENIGIPFDGAPRTPLFPYNPTLDHDIIPDVTINLFRTGQFIHIPSIFGDVTNEGTIFAPLATRTANDSSDFLRSQFPALNSTQLDRIHELYPNNGPWFPIRSGSYWRQASAVYGELRYICPGLLLSRTLASNNQTNTSIWNYRYNVEDPVQMAKGEGVPHSQDVYAIFGPDNTGGGWAESLKTRNKYIVPEIQAYWTSFIRSFDPNMHRLPNTTHWEVFNAQDQQRIVFQTNHTRMEMVPQDQRDRCSYFDSIAESIQQ